MYISKEKDTPQTRKATVMKKVSLQTILNTLTSNGFQDEDILEEIRKEINKGAARKEATAAEYEAAKDVIIKALGDTPVTCGELYEAIKDELPEGFGKGKVQWALIHLWDSEIVKIDGKPNTYRRA